MPRPKRHGQRACWQNGCDRPECEEASRAYNRAYWQERKQYMRSVPDVDASAVEAHLRDLRASGMGYRQIAAASGVGVTTIQRVSGGQRARGVRPETARRILAVTLDPAWFDATGTRRRIRALAAQGYTMAKIAAEAGVTERTVNDVVAARGLVFRDTARGIRAVYEAWQMIPGPSDRARRLAVSKGWAPPLAWEEGTIDDPDASPIEAEPEGRSKLDLDEWWMLVTAGEDPKRAADRCGVLVGTIERAAQRAGRKDLAAVAAHARGNRWKADA